MRLIVPPPVQGLLALAAMWSVSKIAPGLNFAFPGQRGVALAFIGAGIAIELIAGGAFVAAKTTVNPLKPERASRLVTGGLYRISRNPMYLGLLLLLTGLALWFGNPLNIAVLALFVWYVTTFQIRPEEDALAEKFGAEFDAYRAKVRRWI